METTIPAELLDLKTRLDQWRASRKYVREPMPAELRQAVVEACQQYPHALVRRVLKLDPWRLNKSGTKNPPRPTARTKSQIAFFKLPTDPQLPAAQSTSQYATGHRLQLERPDGARLTLTLHGLDLASIHRLCADFLRG